MISVILNGLVLGTIYTLLALGLTLAFGMMRVVNFAHGDFFAIGAFVAVSTLLWLPAGTLVTFVAALVIAPIASAILAVLLDVAVLRKLHDRHELTTLLATWGVALILQQTYRVVWGSQPISHARPISGVVTMAGFQYSQYRLFVLVFGVVVIAAIYYFFQTSDIGLKGRATIQNREIASAMGIDVKSNTRKIFAFGAGIAALGGVLYVPIGSAFPAMGEYFVVIAFMIVIVGGMESIEGTVVSAYIVGMIFSFLGTYWNTVMAETLIFVIVLAVMLVLQGGITKLWTESGPIQELNKRLQRA